MKVIYDINNFLKKDNVNILAPFTENYSNYDPIVRNISENEYNNNKENDIIMADINKLANNKNKKKKGKKSDSLNNRNNIIIKDNKTLYFKQILSEINVLQSKEVPLQIKFRLGKFHENSNIFPDDLANVFTNNDNEHPIYNFLLKSDLNDISKELKTFQILTEINQLFQVKHYNENYNMLLTRYIISPISANIVLAEWLENTDAILNIIQNEYYKKNIKNYEKEFIDIVEKYNREIEIIKKGSIINEDEKMNVLYNFFDNKLLNPNEWYEGIKRAIWSMACKLIGLGDRHGFNIMLKPNGEVIHIDFGYVAGKGTILPIPEIVDFRFTLNIYRTLGIFEDNGLFLFICYKTLELFKNYYSTLKSQIEFYIFDPYFSSGDEQTYKHLKRIDNFFSNPDENLLNQIINMVNDCKDPKKLEEMFIGWMPFI
jgi:phosphatidylinositol kinase/protein kinase (PI-3  family)